MTAHLASLSRPAVGLCCREYAVQRPRVIIYPGNFPVPSHTAVLLPWPDCCVSPYRLTGVH